MLTPAIGNTLAEFFRLRGLPVQRAANAWWTPFSHGSRFLMSLPEQITVGDDRHEIAALLRRERLLAARYPVAAGPGLASGYYCWRRQEFGLPSLDRKLRNNVRRGLEQCALRELEPAELLRLGLDLNRDTMERQGRFNPEFGEEALWARFVEAVRRTPGMSITGAFVEDELAAYSIECRADGWWYALYQNSRSSRLKSFPNHALDYYSLERASKDEDIQGVLNSPLPLALNEGLHDYKTRFGYGVAPYRLVIQLHPFAQPVVESAAVRGGLMVAHELVPGEPRLLKAARFWAGAPAPGETPDPAYANAAPVRFAHSLVAGANAVACPDLPKTARHFVHGTSVVGAALAVASVGDLPFSQPGLLAMYLAGALLTSTMKIRLPGLVGAVGANFVFILLAAGTLGWSETVLIAMLSAVFESFWRAARRPRAIQVAFNASALGVSAGVAVAVHQLAGLAWPAVPALPMVAGATTLFLTNSWLVSTVLGLVTQRPVGAVWQQCHMWTFPYYLTGGILTTLLVQTNTAATLTALVLAVALMYLTYASWRQLVARLAPPEEDKMSASV